MLERLFGLRARGTNLRTEVLAGFATFLTMAYIIAVNPAILGQAGVPAAGAAAATCVAAALGCLTMGLVANYPIAMAPGMGLNAYFTFGVVMGLGLPWQTALGCVFVAGALFLLLTLAGARRLLVESIPAPLLAATAAGIGLFIAFIGLRDAGVVVADAATAVRLGDITHPMPALALGGLMLTAALLAWRVPGAILAGVLATAGAAWALGLVQARPPAYGAGDLASAALQLDIPGALDLAGPMGMAVAEATLVFLFVTLLDNVGTLAAVSRQAGLTDPEGRIPRLDRVLLADSATVMAGAAAGTSPVVSYIESASGVAAGGRTGLTAVTVGLLFLVALGFAPLAQAIPTAATAPALIAVGAMMMGGLKDIDWGEAETAIPAFLILVGIPLTYSIANGIALGVIAYAALRLLRGRAQRREWLLYALAALFAARFAWLGAG